MKHIHKLIIKTEVEESATEAEPPMAVTIEFDPEPPQDKDAFEELSETEQKAVAFRDFVASAVNELILKDPLKLRKVLAKMAEEDALIHTPKKKLITKLNDNVIPLNFPGGKE